MKLFPILLLSAVIFASSPLPRVSLTHLSLVERRTNQRIALVAPVEPVFLLGPTRGVYLDDYGAVFSAEVDLVPNAAPNPFRSALTPADIKQLKAKKQERIAALKQRMVESLMDSVGPLDNVPLDKKVALAISIPYHPFEDRTGLPRQIVVEAPRRALVTNDFATVQKAALVREEF